MSIFMLIARLEAAVVRLSDGIYSDVESILTTPPRDVSLRPFFSWNLPSLSLTYKSGSR